MSFDVQVFLVPLVLSAIVFLSVWFFIQADKWLYLIQGPYWDLGNKLTIFSLRFIRFKSLFCIYIALAASFYYANLIRKDYSIEFIVLILFLGAGFCAFGLSLVTHYLRIKYKKTIINNLKSDNGQQQYKHKQIRDIALFKKPLLLEFCISKANFIFDLLQLFKRQGHLYGWKPGDYLLFVDEKKSHIYDLMSSIHEFNETIVREVMVPRTDMVSLSIGDEQKILYNLLLDGLHSRIPVHDDNIDKILGVLYLKDLFQYFDGNTLKLPASKQHYLDMIRPTFYVPEMMKIADLVKEFQIRHTHLAIVVDEYGGTSGLITLEDCIEELFGDIQDESDSEEKQLKKIKEGHFMADARVHIDECQPLLDLMIQDNNNYETLGGYLIDHYGKVPVLGDEIVIKPYTFYIRDADEKRIKKIEIKKDK